MWLTKGALRPTAQRLMAGHGLNGRDFKRQGYEDGYFIGGTLFDNVTTDMKIYKEEDFPAKARHIGEQVTAGFKAMAEKYDVIGDIRGLGAMIGVEFVKDRETKEPATELVANLIQEALQRGLLMESAGTAGRSQRSAGPWLWRPNHPWLARICPCGLGFMPQGRPCRAMPCMA
mgnify:CR=1 FL=1